MKILGLDQSLTRTGWALLTGTRGSPAFECGSQSFESATEFCHWLAGFLDERWPEFVVWERPTPRVMIYAKKGLVGGMTTPNASQLVLPQLAGMIEMACWDRDIAHIDVASNTWRARVIGKGSGNLPASKTKKAALQACEQFKIPVKNADQAEAALIALYGMTSDHYRLMTQRHDFRATVAANPLSVSAPLRDRLQSSHHEPENSDSLKTPQKPSKPGVE